MKENIPRKIKVLFLVDSLERGGKERQLIELLKGLQQEETVDVQLAVFSNTIHYEVSELSIPVSILERKFAKDPRILLSLYRICKSFQPNIIVSYNSMCSVYAIPVVKGLNVKFINSYLRDVPLSMKPFDPEWIRSKLTFPFSDMILSNSSAGLKAYQVPVRKGRFIHNGFDFSRTRKIATERQIRERFDIETPYIVGMVGRFYPGKDYQTFIQAAIQILRSRRDITFLAIGDGETLESCTALLPEEFKDHFKFLGRQDNVESIINTLTIGVLTSYSEGISNVIMEYMAFGKPVITNEAGGTTELVVDNETGIIVKYQDVNHLARTVLFLLENERIRSKMGLAGKERLKSEFGFDKMISKHIELFRYCLNGESQTLPN